jgi:signal transduction histidine kinase
MENQIERRADISLQGQGIAAQQFTATAWSKGLPQEALGILAHELRAPLHALIGYLDILRDEPVDGEGSRDILERMNSNVYDLSQTVDNLMEFLLAEANEHHVAEEEISLRGLIADITSALEAANANKQLSLRFELKDAPETLRTSRCALRSIILNLALNAIKFTESGTVTITFRRASTSTGRESVEIEVSDTGPGISEAMVNQAMKPFAQLSKASECHHRGVGLGLTVVQRNVAAIGGKLELHSTAGHGARFIVTVPAKTPAANERASREPRLNLRHSPAVLHTTPSAEAPAAKTL